LSWQIYQLLKSTLVRDIGDMWKNAALTLWLGGHFWWMIGELHDYHFPNEPPVYDRHTRQTGQIFIAALIWISFYFLLLKPLGLLNAASSSKSLQKKDPPKWRLSWYFSSWQEYENIHALFWLGKDTAWNWWIPSMLIIFWIPTFLVATDFVVITLYCKRSLIDHAHYCAQLFWVSSTSVWAAGEFFVSPHHDTPRPLFNWNHEIRITSRWYAAWLIVLAFIPIVIMHIIWLYATVNGTIDPGTDTTRLIYQTILEEEEEGEEDGVGERLSGGYTAPLMPLTSIDQVYISAMASSL
jgi:hypothetical protein